MHVIVVLVCRDNASNGMVWTVMVRHAMARYIRTAHHIRGIHSRTRHLRKMHNIMTRYVRVAHHLISVRAMHVRVCNNLR
jgi:hypothetical protein